MQEAAPYYITLKDKTSLLTTEVQEGGSGWSDTSQATVSCFEIVVALYSFLVV